jgi:hypothetical protein
MPTAFSWFVPYSSHGIVTTTKLREKNVREMRINNFDYGTSTKETILETRAKTGEPYWNNSCEKDVKFWTGMNGS